MIQKLKSLVLGNRRLIIPAIGAFLVKETEDVKNRIIFSSFLKYDDGLLTKLLCEQENISEEEAKQIVEKFVHEISDAINKGNNFSIPNFGYFTKNNQGIIDFVIEDTDNNTNSKTGITNMPAENKEEPVFPPYFPPVAETTVFENTEQATQYDFNFPNSFIPPANTANTETTTKSKTSHAGYWILTIVLIIIAVLFLLYLFSKDFKQTVNSLFGSKQKIEAGKDTTTVVADTAKKVQQKDTVTAKQITKNKQTAQTSTNTANGKYQVIAGCYLERSIAENFADELRNKGYNARIPDRLAGEWNLVIVHESNDINDAVRIKDSFVANGYPDTWVRTRAGNSTSSTLTAGQASSYSKATNTAGKTRGRYQTIAGCYLSRENAERYASEIRSKGFDVRIPDGLMGEWNILIVCESDDLNEVNKVKEQCIAAGYDAWIRTR
ncbi:MAG: HU family DNA-binding protein [Prevotellaceae bacterium]|jgi:cell division protein FtsN|nr:HU family DNA-binding protein [Prevotellaceae bacterium]